VSAAVWLADWSDGEDADFRAAWAETGIDVRVIRSAPLGTSVGSRLHRARSWPAYAGLAARGLATARGAPVVAWQPLAGALAAAARVGRRPPLVVLNPLLDPSGGRLHALLLAGVKRADRVVLFTRPGVDVAEALGVSREKLAFVPLGVRARLERPDPPGEYLLAAGREQRDWTTLAAAARGLDVEIRVAGPATVEPPLIALGDLPRERFLEQLRGSRALVVPLARDDRTAGQLAVLDAFSVGRGVVATRAQGTEDYVTEGRGILVPPRDADALRSALVEAAGAATRMGEAALGAARGPLSLARFVSEVDALSNS
jgi:glycosyltransferase involved in cell wall biosynthesis